MTAQSDNRPEQLDLAADFPMVTRDQWRELVNGVLAKSTSHDASKDPEMVLASRTYDDVLIRPLYTVTDLSAAARQTGMPGQTPFVRGATDDDAVLGWDVRQRQVHPEPKLANIAILDDLENGVTSLWLQIGDGAIAVDDLPTVLNGVYLDLAPIVLDAGERTEEAAKVLLGLVAERGVPADELTGSLGADPIGLAARTGATPDIEQVTRVAALAKDFPLLRSVTVDATIYHDAGASDGDELAIATSVGIAYLRALTEAGLSVDEAMQAMEFRYAVTDDQFASIAKLRAGRRIWDRIGQLSGASESARGQAQHAVTSAAMMTQRDPSVNMLRTTVACFAAAAGGALAISVAPYDSAIGVPDELARRIARNTQSVLHDEANLGRVTDPAGGSWFVESLTDELAEAAWAKFTALEAAGTAADLAAVQALIAPTREKRAKNIARRIDPITGVSEFPLIDEALLARDPAPAVASGGLPRLRYAGDYEALRDRADAYLAKTGARPVVFIAALGPVAAHSARLGFATNLFAAGGIAGVVGTGSVEELVDAYQTSGASIACLCSSDAVYSDDAAAVASVLRNAGAQQIWLAGKAGERAESDSEAGVSGYLYARCDALAVLTSALDAAIANISSASDSVTS
jgi:methylmalonyl-CoA mutase